MNKLLELTQETINALPTRTKWTVLEERHKWLKRQRRQDREEGRRQYIKILRTKGLLISNQLDHTLIHIEPKTYATYYITITRSGISEGFGMQFR